MKHVHINALISELKRNPDPRQAWKIKHTLYEILLITIIAVIANANSSYEIYVVASCHHEWLKQFMPLENGIQTRLTIERVLRLMNPKRFHEAFMQIMKNIQSQTHGTIVALDGKAYHSSKEGSGSHQVQYMMSAWCSANGMTLAQVETNGKGSPCRLRRCLILVTAYLPPALITALCLHGCCFTEKFERGQIHREILGSRV